VIALKPCATREIGWLTGGASLLAMRGHGRAWVSAADGWGRAAVRESEHAGRAVAREEAGRRWVERGEVARAGRERPRVLAGNWPNQGKGFFFYFSQFLFSFPISISFISFPLEQLIN
jgi:hypothetical protein